MSGNPRQNRVAERHNRIRMDIVRSMLSYSMLSINLWMEVLKTIVHILNRVPSKSVHKMSYELWIDRKPILNYLHVWGCPAEANVFNPNIGKLDPKTAGCNFIGYLDKSKAFHFYCPHRHTKFVEMRHTVFLEDEMIRGSTVSREIRLEEKRVYVLTPMVEEPFFSISADVTPILQGNVVATTVVDSSMTMVATPVVGSPMVEIDEEEEPITTYEEEQQRPPMQDVAHDEPPRRSQRAKRSAISDDYEVYISEQIQMEGDPTSFEEAMKSGKMK
jgi:hypothetical protein